MARIHINIGCQAIRSGGGGGVVGGDIQACANTHTHIHTTDFDCFASIKLIHEALFGSRLQG